MGQRLYSDTRRRSEAGNVGSINLALLLRGIEQLARWLAETWFHLVVAPTQTAFVVTITVAIPVLVSGVLAPCARASIFTPGKAPIIEALLDARLQGYSVVICESLDPIEVEDSEFGNLYTFRQGSGRWVLPAQPRGFQGWKGLLLLGMDEQADLVNISSGYKRLMVLRTDPEILQRVSDGVPTSLDGQNIAVVWESHHYPDSLDPLMEFVVEQMSLTSLTDAQIVAEAVIRFGKSGSVEVREELLSTLAVGPFMRDSPETFRCEDLLRTLRSWQSGDRALVIANMLDDGVGDCVTLEDLRGLIQASDWEFELTGKVRVGPAEYKSNVRERVEAAVQRFAPYHWLRTVPRFSIDPHAKLETIRIAAGRGDRSVFEDLVRALRHADEFAKLDPRNTDLSKEVSAGLLSVLDAAQLKQLVQVARERGFEALERAVMNRLKARGAGK